MDEVTRDMVKAQLKSAKTPEALKSWLEEQRDKSLLPTTKAIYQAIIDRIDERLEGN